MTGVKMFTEFSIGNVKLKNRLLMAPMETNMASLNGEVNDRVIHYYAERAKGGVGAIIVEFTCVDTPIGKGAHVQLSIDSDAYISGHNYLVEEIKKYDCKAFLQLHHAGRQTSKSIAKGQPVAPSPIPCKVMKTMPRELATEEVEDIVFKFVKAARRAKLAGYDGVELHAAHGYLLGSFLSPYTNKRRDKYGGSLENRVRIILEIIAGIRKIGLNDFPVIVRISADEFVDGGITIEEAVEISRLLESGGADAIHVSTGIFESNDKNIDPMSASQGWRIKYAKRIKQAVDIPVIGVGVIREPELANQIIEREEADLIALGRTLIADPYWPKKAQEGAFSQINLCTTCGYCTDRLRFHQSIRCSVNPRAGRETTLKEIKRIPGTEHKTVHVIGAGPVGLYTAYLAGLKGFSVRLYEKSDQLGGLFDVISAPPGKNKWQWFKKFLINQITDMDNVVVVKNCEITRKEIEQFDPEDYIFDCSGVVPKVEFDVESVKIPVYTVNDILKHPLKNMEQKNIIVLGSRGAGLEVAHYLADKNNKVIVVSRSGPEANGLNIDSINRMDLLRNLKEKGVDIINHADVIASNSGDIEVVNVKTNEKFALDYKIDAIVLARGFHSNHIDHSRNIVKIGGSEKPNKILEGVYKAYLEVSKIS